MSKNFVFRVDVVRRTLQKEVLSEISANIAKPWLQILILVVFESLPEVRPL